MTIGDKVRMLRAKEQGIVTRLLPDNQVEIEIEDGFRIPVLRSELVVVSPMEEQQFGQELGVRPQQPVKTGLVGNAGIFLAFIPQNDREMGIYLINNTDWDFPFTIGEEKKNQYTGLRSGVLKSRTQTSLNQLYTISTFEEWPTFLIQGLWFRFGTNPLRAPFIKRMKARAQTFYKNKKNTPLVNQLGYVFQLDEESVDKPLEPASLREQWLNATKETEPVVIKRPASIVDLHIEKLLPQDASTKNGGDIIELQLITFEKSLENAIASGMDEITFIHGAGSGLLRNELHRRLGKNPGVQYFEDAQKEKFGYGATKVKIK